MYFLDNSGHTFTLTSYKKKPIGYEYEENPYVFWINDTTDCQNLSINNYYARSINILYEIEDNIDIFSENNISDLYDINITIDSKIFSFIKANSFQEKIYNINSITDTIDISTISHTYNSETGQLEPILNLSSNNDEDIIVVKIKDNDRSLLLIPIYVIGKTDEPGTWTSNIMINITKKYNDDQIWCPITVGGTFIDMYETLYIHGKNMGVDLPKDILRAINGTSFFNDQFNEELYNRKLKEYMINYMNIKGECGNYNSAINSLKWFGFYDKLTLYKLVETTNEVKQQFIRDYFDIHTDILLAFKNFINTQYVSLQLKLNKENGERYEQSNINNNEDQIIFWGEGNPKLIDLTTAQTVVETNEYLKEQRYSYIDSYFHYSFNELALKISCLAYYYRKYFLPIFVNLKNISLEHKVYTNDIKLFSYCKTHLHENTINLQIQNNINVEFPKSNLRFITHQYHYVDEHFNEYRLSDKAIEDSTKEELDEIYENSENYDWYLINDTCINVPIKITTNDNTYCSCILILKEKNTNSIIYKNSFNFIQTSNYTYNSFVIYPKLIEYFAKKPLGRYVNSEFTLYLCVNNVWYDYDFIIKLGELDIHIGTLQYQYWCNDINELNNVLKQHKEDDSDNEYGILVNYNDDNKTKLDITNYINIYDFYNEPSKVFSNFSQIKSITDDKVYFNSYMWFPDFINVNDISFGIRYWDYLYDNDGDDTRLSKIGDLVSRYQEKINISNTYKYLNNVHIYNLFKLDVKGDTEDDRQDILAFYNNITVRYKNLLFDKQKYTNTFTVSGIIDDESVSTKDGQDAYIISSNKPEIIEGKALYYIIGRTANYDIDENNINAESLYNIIEDNDEISIGYCIYKDYASFASNENKYVQNNLNPDVDIKNIYIENNNYVYLYKGEKHILSFSYSFVKKTNNQYNDFIPTTNEFIKYYNNNTNNIYLKVNFYYKNQTKILNIFGYYNSQNCSDLEKRNDGKYYCTVKGLKDTITGNELDPIPNVRLEESNYYQYFLNNGKTIDSLDMAYVQNPSFYWSKINSDGTIEYNYHETYKIDQNTLQLKSPTDDYDEYTYINYLCKDFTGLKGLYKLDCECDSTNICVKLCIFDERDNIVNEYINHGYITLSGNEYKVLLFFSCNSSIVNPVTITPHLYKISTIEHPIPYDSTSNEVDLYKEFFYKKFTITCNKVNNITTSNNATTIDYDEGEIIKEVYDSYIQFNEKYDYDMFLMHDKQQYYIVFISKDTCDKFASILDINKYQNTIEFTGNSGNQYILRHASSDNIFLINRMQFIDSNGKNHFNSDDLIICSLENNKMLPTNLDVYSKWNIQPISFGISNNVKIYGNSNMSILSIPKNDNIYNKGYYNINVKYSLDKSHIYNKKIKEKILIK